MNAERTILKKSTDNFKNPFVPNGFTYVKGKWNNGFVISDIYGNEFAWIPVGSLKRNGTLDGVSFDKQFGLRNWYKNDFSENGWHEVVPQEVLKSIEVYGGFYFSCFPASLENSRVVFKRGNYPLVKITYFEALKYEKSFQTDSSEVEHCLMFGSAYDSLFEWIIEAGTLKKDEVLDDSTELGNYANNVKYVVKSMAKTGSNEAWGFHNIYDLAGNVSEWTQEQYSDYYRVLRSCNYRTVGRYWPMAERYYREYPNFYAYLGSFRTMMYHK